MGAVDQTLFSSSSNSKVIPQPPYLSMPIPIQEALMRALSASNFYRGNTSPNPPVGATGLDRQGRILGVAAHEQAGLAHAETKLITLLKETQTLSRLETLVITLEPCNHFGKTPPCTEMLIHLKKSSLAPKLKTLWIGAKDPNPNVKGLGAQTLNQAGIQTHWIDPQSDIGKSCALLLAPFKKAITTQIPYLTIKTAFRKTSSTLTMIPPQGKRTFTSLKNLRLAHSLRKRADAILTGSGTILADNPAFTVRWVSDFPNRSREIIILDRRKRVSPEYLLKAQERGFKVYIEENLELALKNAALRGVLEILVEAGPTLTQSVLETNFWDEQVLITQGETNETLEIRYRT